MKNKKRILKIIISILIIIALIIIIYIFYKNTNKNLKTGNNLSNKTSQEIEEYILNISSYEAEIELEVETNKNKTMYKIKQSYTAGLKSTGTPTRRIRTAHGSRICRFTVPNRTSLSPSGTSTTSRTAITWTPRPGGLSGMWPRGRFW